MCPLSVALHYVLVLLAVTINTIGGEPCVDVFSELPRVFWGVFPRFIPWEETVWYSSFLHWLCVSGLLNQLNAHINGVCPFRINVFVSCIILTFCKYADVTLSVLYAGIPGWPFASVDSDVTLRFGTVNCEYQYYRMRAFCWCFQWVAKGIWFMHFRVFVSVRKKTVWCR